MKRARNIIVKYLVEWYPRSPLVVAFRATLVFAVFFPVLTLTSNVSYRGQPEGDPSAALVRYLEERGIIADEGSVHWLTPPSTGPLFDWTKRKAVFLGRTSSDAPRDLYLARVRLTPRGKVSTAATWNLSNTPYCSEQGLWARGKTAAVGGKASDGFSTLALHDFRGEDPETVRSWPLVERIKRAVTNYQNTGQPEGINSAFLEFSRPQKKMSVEFTDTALLVNFEDGGTKVAVSSGGFTHEEGVSEGLFEFNPVQPAVPGHVAWIVDTARATELIGKEKIGWAEAKWYRIEDFFKRVFYAAAGSDYAARSIKEDMGEIDEDRDAVKEFLAEREGSGIPDLTPPDVEPLDGMDPMEGEGKWRPVLGRTFNLRDEHAPPSLYRTFVRPDPKRPFAHAHLVGWDPRMVELHVSAGAVEPKSASGRAGTGMIPRDDETMERTLAGFNGGFQALHGEFGLMQEGKVYLPPKPWAATVALLKGGRIGFGTWPGPETGPIQPEIVSYRQNLTPLMQDGEVNPYKRHWWGSSPDLNPDSPMIARSGICVTQSNHLLYSLAYSVNEYTYADAMKKAGCRYLIQLDVNTGHSGFEFIRITPEDETPSLERELDKEWEAEGKVKDRDDLVFRSKKLFKQMRMMRFPRYTGREPRDFFYITLTRNLPGPAFVPAKGKAEAWRTDLLPGNRFPPSFAYASVRNGDRSAAKVVRMDPRWTETGVMGAGSGTFAGKGCMLTLPSCVSIHVSGTPGWSLAEGDLAIVFGYDELAQEWKATYGKWNDELLQAFSRVIAMKIPEKKPGDGAPSAGAFGIGPHRFFAWAESSDGKSESLKNALEGAGAKTIVEIPAVPGESAGWSFIDEKDGNIVHLPLLNKKGAAPMQPALTFVPAERDVVVRLFPETEVVLPKVWNPPQVKRIRYFRPEPEPDAGASGNDASP